jgi:hypothetical protein
VLPLIFASVGGLDHFGSLDVRDPADGRENVFFGGWRNLRCGGALPFGADFYGVDRHHRRLVIPSGRAGSPSLSLVASLFLRLDSRRMMTTEVYSAHLGAGLPEVAQQPKQKILRGLRYSEVAIPN